jgi:hypothetical protein
MIEQTINGNPVIIIYRDYDNRYDVYFEGEWHIVKDKPSTDQDVETYLEQTTNIRQEIINTRGQMLGNTLSELIESGLNLNN